MIVMTTMTTTTAWITAETVVETPLRLAPDGLASLWFWHSQTNRDLCECWNRDTRAPPDHALSVPSQRPCGVPGGTVSISLPVNTTGPVGAPVGEPPSGSTETA